MTTLVAPDRESDHSQTERPTTRERDPVDTARREPDPRSFDPTQGRKIGADPYDDPTQGRKVGSDRYDDPTQGRRIGSDPTTTPLRDARSARTPTTTPRKDARSARTPTTTRPALANQSAPRPHNLD
jgi:hypothetical protein